MVLGAGGESELSVPFSLFYPTRGDFIAIVGSTAWRQSTRKVVAQFRRSARFPSEAAAAMSFDFLFSDDALGDGFGFGEGSGGGDTPGGTVPQSPGSATPPAPAAS